MSSRGDRWDRDRFEYERESGRGRVEDDKYSTRGGRGRDHSEERYDRRYYRTYEEDAPPREQRRFHDDDYMAPRPERRREPPPEADYDRRRRVVELEMEREREQEPRRERDVRRPTFLARRQSSLDTYDRRPMRKFFEHTREEYPAPVRLEDIRRDDYRMPPNKEIPLPKTKGLPPPRHSDRYEEERYYHDEIRVSDHDHRGDDGHQPYAERVEEREVIRTRRRRDSDETRSSRTRTRRGSEPSTANTTTTSSRSSSNSSGGTTIASEYPKKGKTRIPTRLVSKRAIIDIGYPFTEEGNTIIIQKALGQHNIDQLLKLSEEYNKSDAELAKARSSAGDIDERKTEIFIVPPQPPPAPPTIVRPTPVAVPAPPPVVIAQPPPAPAPAPLIIDVGSVRDTSPSRTATTSTSSYDSSSYYYLNNANDQYDHYAQSHHHHGGHHHHEHSSEIPIDALTLADGSRSRSRSRTGRREIRAEIRALERQLAKRSKSKGHNEVVHTERLPNGELVVYQEQSEHVHVGPKPPRIEKNRKGQLSISLPKIR